MLITDVGIVVEVLRKFFKELVLCIFAQCAGEK
jgi:hypothetical protein